MKKLLSILIIIAICFSIFTACDPKQRNDLDESIFVDSSISGGEDSQFQDSSVSDSNSSGSSSANKDQSNSSEQENDDCLIFFITEDFEIEVGSIYQLEFEIIGSFTGVDVRYRASNDCVSISYDGMLTAVKEGECEVEISLMDKSDKITVTVYSSQSLEKYYSTISESEFYANYTPAKNYADALLRSKYYLMSGSIEAQDQAPTIADNRPIDGDLFLKNSNARYSADKNVYYVVDKNGIVVKEIYKGGAYVTLEDVAAYLFAFNDIPANYTTSKSTKPTSSPWGKYLRLNHSQFSGDTSRYPYEPELPNISGCRGTYQYYELDIGTTGTTAGDYSVAVYNNGSKITRGAARIVYSRFDGSSPITDLSEKYLFYTYNHYNDFQEYLNYYNGWGEMFGNITGGGTLSSKYDYNPTPYVEVKLYNFNLIGGYGEDYNSPVNIFGNYLEGGLSSCFA